VTDANSVSVFVEWNMGGVTKVASSDATSLSAVE
jgi:hypothetical protein